MKKLIVELKTPGSSLPIKGVPLAQEVRVSVDWIIFLALYISTELKAERKEREGKR